MITYRNNGQIKDYWPDSDKDTLYLTGKQSLQDIMDQAKDHFGDRFDAEKISLEAEHIHTSCLGYDCYDPGDWTDFIIVELEAV